MKAPDDIKEALRKCIGWNSGYSCGECPYWNGSAMCKPELCNDAIACIDQLEKKTKWISVEEREPEFPCICYDGVNVISIPKNIASLTLKSGEKVFVSDAFLEAFPHALLEKLDDCTHILYWMPLPEPPKEDLE